MAAAASAGEAAALSSDTTNLVLGALNLLANGGLVFILERQTTHNRKNAGNPVWGSGWAYLDLAFIIGNLAISGLILRSAARDMEILRAIEAFTLLLLAWKSLYFLQLIDRFSPWVLVIFKIFYAIRAFVVIQIICLFGFASAFYMLGRNQL